MAQRILVVDDDREFLEASRYPEAAGYEVVKLTPGKRRGKSRRNNRSTW